MKQLRKTAVWVLCVCVIFGMTACGTKKENENTDNKTTTESTDNNKNMNDATDGTDTDGDGVLDDVGDDIRDGVDDIGDDIKDGADDLKDDVTNDTNQDGVPDNASTEDGMTNGQR